VDVWELFVLAIVAMVQVIVLIVLAPGLVHYRKLAVGVSTTSFVF
jgi:membrane protein YdbS with pleckstrin-like domain